MTTIPTKPLRTQSNIFAATPRLAFNATTKLTRIRMMADTISFGEDATHQLGSPSVTPPTFKLLSVPAGSRFPSKAPKQSEN